MGREKKSAENLNDYAEKILYLSRLNGWSTYDLAKYSGVKQSTISSWSSGRNQPSIKNLEKICDALGISIEDFLENDQFRLADESFQLCMIYRRLDTNRKAMLFSYAKYLDSENGKEKKDKNFFSRSGCSDMTGHKLS